MESLQSLGEAARKILGDMSVTQRLTVMMLGLTVAIALGLMAFIGSISEERGYIALPIKVEPGSDFDDIKTLLDDEGIEYKYVLDDRQVQVPIADRDRAYMLLASQDLFNGDSYLGFEDMLEKGDFTTPPKVQQDMMQVALQNELAKMIESLDVIKEAKVIIDGGKQRVLGPQVRSRASVKVTTALGKKMTQDIADAIISLVSSSKSGMNREEVWVVDQNARRFHASMDDSISSQAAHRLETQRREEDRMRQKVEELVRQFYPGVEAFAFVNIEQDFDAVDIQTVEILEGQIKRKVTSSQTHKSVDTPPSEVGTNPNINRASAGAGAGNTTESKIKTADNTMENGRKVTSHKVAPGDVEQMSVSVVLQLPYEYEMDDKGARATDDNGNYIKKTKPLLSQLESDQLAQHIANAAGLASMRDVTIRQNEWKPPVELMGGEQDTASFLRDIAIQNVAAIMLTFAAVAAMAMIWMQVRKTIPEEQMELFEEASMESDEDAEEVSETDKANASFEQMRNRIADLVSEDPKKAASLVRRWLVME